MGTLPESGPTDVFRQNLHRFAAARGWGDYQAIANGLMLHGDDRRWLWRAWNRGLRRPDKRRAKTLKQIAQWLGLHRAADLWRADVKPRLADFDHDASFWRRAVLEIVAWHHVIERGLAERQPDVVELLRLCRGDAVKVITVMVGGGFGILRIQDTPYIRRPETLQRLLDETMPDLQVVDSFTRHVIRLGTLQPAWRRFADSICREKVGDGEPRNPEERGADRESVLFEHVRTIVKQILLRRPNRDEVWQEFWHRILRGFERSDDRHE